MHTLPQDDTHPDQIMAGVNALDEAVLHQLARAVRLLDDATLGQLVQLGELGEVVAGMLQVAHDPDMPPALRERLKQHSEQLENHIGVLLDGLNGQDVINQIIDRIKPAVRARQAVLADLEARAQAQGIDLTGLAVRAQALVVDYVEGESLHHGQTAEQMSRPSLLTQSIDLL